MSFYVVIPARYDSSRFPGKPLIDLNGKTMIRRVYEQACLSDASDIFVATDDERIIDEVERFGGKVVKTSSAHTTGTERIFEAASTIKLPTDATIVNLQGDEPLMPPSAINQVAGAVTSGEVPMATLKELIVDRKDIFDPNLVKVVTDQNDIALYFSRAPIPWSRQGFATDNIEPGEGDAWYRHLGLYAYKHSLLARYVSWPPGKLEQLESLEQLRVLENGERIKVLTATESIPAGIDVPSDVTRTLKYLKDN